MPSPNFRSKNLRTKLARGLALGVGAVLFTPGARAQGAPVLPRASAASFAPSFVRLYDSGPNLGPAPVDALARQELRQGGYTETAKALQAVIPIVNSPHFGIDDGSAHLEPFTLRGLSPDHTQVLVNGHRLHTTALLNVNNTIGRGSMSTSMLAIPMAALDGVEILRDGSDARFGNGAIAGVVNLRLREDAGRHLYTFWGQTAEGDGNVKQAVFGAGGTLGRDGTINVTLAWRDRDATDRAEPDTRQQYLGRVTATGEAAAISGNIDSGTGAAPAGIAFDAREAAANRRAQRYGDAEVQGLALVLNGRLPLSPQSELYGFGTFLQRRGESAAFFRRPGDSRVVRALWPDGFQPLLDSRVADWFVGGGWRGRSNDWRYDTALVAGANTIAYDVKNTNNATLGAKSPREFYAGKLGYAEAAASLDLSRPVGLGLAKPAEVAFGLQYRRENYWIGAGNDDSWRDGGSLIVDGPDAGREAPEGAQGFPGFRPADEVDAIRRVGAANAEIAQKFGERLLVVANGRYEKADKLGETTDGKLAARLTLWGGVAVRGSVGRTYRQPHLAQQWFSSTATNFIGGLPFENRTFPVANPVARALGATALKPERGVTMNAGAVWEPAPTFGAEVDFYRVDVRDRLILTSNFLGSAVATFLESQGVSGATGGRFFSNDAATRTEGFDAALHSKWAIAPDHELTLRAAYNYNRSRLIRVGPTPAGLAALGVTTPLFDSTEETRLTRGQPRDNLRLSAIWDWGRLQTTLRVMRYGEVEAVALTNVTADQIATLTPGYRVQLLTRTLATTGGAVGGAPQLGGPTTVTDVVQIFEAKWVTDLNLRYRLTDKMHLSLGASNLFDVYPARNIASRLANGRAYAGADNGGTTPYNTTSPFGFNGAFYYTRFDFEF